MKRISAEQIAEISYSNSRYAQGWSFYVVGEQGDRLSDLEADKSGVMVPAIVGRFETKAAALTELAKLFPNAIVLNKRAFREEHLLRSHRGDHS